LLLEEGTMGKKGGTKKSTTRVKDLPAAKTAVKGGASHTVHGGEIDVMRRQ
jgi:hypothetical protein